jgi:hypothetical protein
MISTYMDKFFIIILIVLISKNTSFIILLTIEIQIQAGIIADRQTYQRFSGRLISLGNRWISEKICFYDDQIHPGINPY